MKPAPFSYVRPDTCEEAFEVLAKYGADARILAGGQSLIAMLNIRLVTPSVLIDIGGMSALTKIEVQDGAIEIGAAVTQAALLKWPSLNDTQPFLAQILPWVGHYQTRHRGTVCGSLAHGDPSAELPLALCHLGGSVVLESHRMRRVLSANSFQTGMMSTALEPDEMIVACRFPVVKPGTYAAFREISQRQGDFAIAALAASVSSQGIRVSAGGVADRPMAKDWPVDRYTDLDDALNEFAWELGGSDDVHASARYRRELVRRVGRQVVGQAMKEAGHAEI
jgi:2-furoyl-CoA dehydrogenase FAD binding subunit